MNIRKLAVFLVLLYCFLSGMLAAENTDPAWVYYEKALYEMSKKEYGQALYYLKLALELQPLMPEAEMAIGDIYFYKPEYTLAELQYKKAYDNRKAFLIPDYKYILLYKMVRLYRNWYKYLDMVATLNMVIEDDIPNYKDFESRMKKLYIDKGFDALLRYYRLEQTFAAQAHCELAWYSYRMHRFDTAIMHSILGIVSIISEAMRELRRVMPDYEYTTLDDFLNTAFNNRVARTYLQQTRLFEHLYYLAASSWEKGHFRNAKYIWQVIAASPYSEGYAKNAQDQLTNPRLEPALQVGESWKH